MNYRLTRHTLDAKHALPISADDFEAIKLAKERIFHMVTVEEKLDMVLQNYFDFEHEIMKITLEKALTSFGGWTEGRDIVQLANRRLANLFTTCRLYLDQLPHDLSPLFKSPNTDSIKRHTSKEYDARLGYRVLEALRNYVQHRGLPVHSITLGGHWLETDERHYRKHTTQLSLDINTLKQDKKFKRSVLSDLNADRPIPLKALVRDYITGIMQVQINIRTELKAEIEEDEKLIESMIRKYSEEVENNIVGLAAVASGESGKNAEKVQLFVELIERRRSLTHKNRGGGDLTKLVISSE